MNMLWWFYIAQSASLMMFSCWILRKSLFISKPKKKLSSDERQIYGSELIVRKGPIFKPRLAIYIWSMIWISFTGQITISYIVGVNK